METTTHSTSKGDVLPSTDHDHDDYSDLLGEDDATRARLTFEQRTIRTLLSFERRRLAIEQKELAMEEERFAAHRDTVVAERIDRAVRFETLAQTVNTHLPLLLPILLERLGLGIPEAAPAAAEKKPIVPEWRAERPKAESPRAAVG